VHLAVAVKQTLMVFQEVQDFQAVVVAVQHLAELLVMAVLV
jgi:hypothetical protein